MKVFTESIVSEMKPVENSKSPGTLCIMSGPCMQFGAVNRNNRIYSRKLVEDRILKNPTVQEAIKNRAMLGEGGHPENRVDISYPEVALAVEKLWIPEGDGDMLWGRFAILDTPTGRILETLVKYGTKLGISARAVADSIQKDGHEVILENSYELITFDAVPEPGFKCARLEQVDSVSKPVDKMSTKELKESVTALRSFKNPVFESRIRTLDKEICKRENKADIHAILESVDRLSDTLNKSENKLQHIKYEKQLTSLIKEVKDLISDAKKFNESSSRSVNKSTNKKHSISNICSDDISINKFNTERHLNENININGILNKDNTALEKMCSPFRRNSYE
jgi:hypothetical protein